MKRVPAENDRANEEIERVVRRERGRLVATLIRLVGDVDLAEEILHETLVVAMETWPASGLPNEPGAWLTTVARRRALDVLRRARALERKKEQIVHLQDEDHDPFGAAFEESAVRDDQLRLIFVCCHPELPPEAQVALTLKLVVGMSTPQIARAFLVPEPTVAQRLVRAKKTLAERKIPYEVPEHWQLAERLESVLAVVYLLYNEGYLAHRGAELERADLSEEALRLGAQLAELLPAESEVLGLLALMELQASRASARRNANGGVVLLPDQDRSQWDRDLVERGLDHLNIARVRAAGEAEARGSYLLQAGIAACHARASEWAGTAWDEIVHLYTELLAIHDSPVVALNRAIAIGMAEGPTAGIAALDAIARDESAKNALDRYAYWHASRADFLRRLKRSNEAATSYRRAIECTENEAERAFLRGRLAELTAVTS